MQEAVGAFMTSAAFLIVAFWTVRTRTVLKLEDGELFRD